MAFGLSRWLANCVNISCLCNEVHRKLFCIMICITFSKHIKLHTHSHWQELERGQLTHITQHNNHWPKDIHQHPYTQCRTANDHNPHQQTQHSFQPINTTRCTSLRNIRHRHNKLHTTHHCYTRSRTRMWCEYTLWYSMMITEGYWSPISLTIVAT